MADPADRAKAAAARAAVAEIREERAIALGTGSTAAYAIREIATARPELRDRAYVASSRASEELARGLGLPVRELRPGDRFDLMLDGADEVSASLDLTKGGGGALFREKFLARLSRRLVILVDPAKLVDRLGRRHALPIEVVPFARPALAHDLASAGYRVDLRGSVGGAPFRTDNGNEILDLWPGEPLLDPAATDRELRALPGVVETGIFPAMADRVVVGRDDGSVERRDRPAPRRG